MREKIEQIARDKGLKGLLDPKFTLVGPVTDPVTDPEGGSIAYYLDCRLKDGSFATTVIEFSQAEKVTMAGMGVGELVAYIKTRFLDAQAGLLDFVKSCEDGPAPPRLRS